jgi:hypothetical protein
MSEPEESNEEDLGTVDLASVLYVVCGIPAMILFFVVLFGLVGACDLTNVMIPA